MFDRHQLQAMIESFVRSQIANWSITSIQNITCPANDKFANQYNTCVTLLKRILNLTNVNDGLELIDMLGESERLEKKALDAQRQSWSYYFAEYDETFHVTLRGLRNLLLMQMETEPEFIVAKNERMRIFSNYLVNNTKLLAQPSVSPEVLVEQQRQQIHSKKQYENLIYDPTVFDKFFQLVVKKDLAYKYQLINLEAHDWVHFDEYTTHKEEQKFIAGILKANQPHTTSKIQDRLEINNCKAVIPYEPNPFTQIIASENTNIRSSNPNLNRLFEQSSQSKAIIKRQPTIVSIYRKLY